MKGAAYRVAGRGGRTVLIAGDPTLRPWLPGRCKVRWRSRRQRGRSGFIFYALHCPFNGVTEVGEFVLIRFRLTGQGKVAENGVETPDLKKERRAAHWLPARPGRYELACLGPTTVLFRTTVTIETGQHVVVLVRPEQKWMFLPGAVHSTPAWSVTTVDGSRPGARADT